GDAVVVHFDVRLAVEDHADPLARELDAQRVPGVAGHRRIDVFQRIAPPLRRVVERYVVLQRVGARDVVVVAVLPAPYHPACLILAARERLEIYLDETPGGGHVARTPPGKTT